jgi:uncharacterized protein DUF3352
MPRVRLSIPALAVAASLVVVGCGSDDDSAGTQLSGLAAPGSLVFVEAKLKPSGDLKSNVDSIAKRLTGVSSLGGFVISELEGATQEDGDSFDFSREVEPWLGERGGIAFERLVDGELSEPLIAVQTKEPKATQAFVDAQTAKSNDPSKDVSYKGVEFKVGGSDNDAIGVIGDALVLADNRKEFKAAVDASQGESLGDEDRFEEAIAAASSGSFADIYVDVGGVLDQSEDKIDPRARQVLRSAGIDPGEATVVASVIPRSAQIEVDLSSDLGGEQAPAGDASKLLGTLPAGAFAAFAFSEFGEQLEEAIDSLDESGLPPDLEPNELKGTLKRAGIDLNKLAGSLQEAAVFAEGGTRESLGGALVLMGRSDEAADAVAGLGVLLQSARVPGVAAVGGQASGFSVRNEELGDKPLVVVGKGNRVAIGYGVAPARAGLKAGSGATLSDTADYRAAVASLGKTPISAFVDGPAARKLAEALVPRSSTDFWAAVPYLKKISYIGLGIRANGELATAKLIAGIGR